MEELKLENKKAIMQQFFENVGGSMCGKVYPGSRQTDKEGK